jgi:hypothetical protein
MINSCQAKITLINEDSVIGDTLQIFNDNFIALKGIVCAVDAAISVLNQAGTGSISKIRGGTGIVVSPESGFVTVSQSYSPPWHVGATNKPLYEELPEDRTSQQLELPTFSSDFLDPSVIVEPYTPPSPPPTPVPRATPTPTKTQGYISLTPTPTPTRASQSPVASPSPTPTYTPTPTSASQSPVASPSPTPTYTPTPTQTKAASTDIVWVITGLPAGHQLAYADNNNVSVKIPYNATVGGYIIPSTYRYSNNTTAATDVAFTDNGNNGSYIRTITYNGTTANLGVWNSVPWLSLNADHSLLGASNSLKTIINAINDIGTHQITLGGGTPPVSPTPTPSNPKPAGYWEFKNHDFFN